MDASHFARIADEIVSAGTALAGLILIFIGNAAASFDAVPAGSRDLMRGRFRWRVWTAFAGFAASLLSVFAVIGYNECAAEWLMVSAIASLVIALLVSLVLAFLAAKGVG